ncbi:dixin isoform X1 [Hippocampus comes]|uniref:dixin isoform X1 n=1 Tax=Hippocampus comes TaxID=109280 RepID=UPI00094E7C9F|nr:PREDICTED: dixin isoform X1 [Hippocampus comes]
MIASLSRGSLLDEVLHGGFNEQQLATYISWVNAQLKKKSGLKPITDLRRDLQDGLVLVQLIEIVAGEVLEGVYLTPQSKEESRKNVEQVLQFISSRHIRMPHISARDIVEGNLKSVMRIILALAAHFKPSTNPRLASGCGKGSTSAVPCHNPLSTVALAQGAAATLASARYDASLPASASRIHNCWRSDVDKSVCVRALVKQYERGTPDEQDDVQTDSLSSVSPLPSPRSPPSTQADRQEEDRAQIEHRVETSVGAADATWEDSISETLEKEVEETRKMVSALQALLLQGSLPEDEQDLSFSLDEGHPEQQMVVIRSRLDQSMEESRELKRELLSCKQEMRNLQGIKEAQQRRLCTQEASILQLKQELLRASMANDDFNNQKTELQWKLEECTRLWSDCKKEVGQKDRLLQQLKQKLEESQKQQRELQKELDHENSTRQEVTNRELQQISQISPCTENNGYYYSGNPASSISSAEEVQLLRDAIRSLRKDLRVHDPQHHTLDTLEQGIVSLIDRLHAVHTHRVRGKSPGRRGQNSDCDSWPKVCQSSSTSTSSTKILYFTGRSPTPFMINIPKRLGEVTLKDVKAAVDQEGNYRYHFKALDPEFGTVKEEVFFDGAIVPGWEGKIVAWVEEDHGEARPS